MKRLLMIDADQVIDVNRRVCLQGENPFQVLNENRVHSALHSAYYPGSYPFAHGGVASICGALAFYLCMAHAFQDGNKRTAVLSALIMLSMNGYEVQYPKTPDRDGLSDLMLSCASGLSDVDTVKKWFENHKV